MSLLLSILSVIIALFGALVYVVLGLVPKLGIFWLKDAFLKRLILEVVAIGMSIASYLQAPSTFEFGSLVTVLVFAGFVFVVSPSNIFPALRNTEHFRKENADVNDAAEVLGLSNEGSALAWAITGMVIPHHAVNDQIDAEPVLVSYCPACNTGVVYSRLVDGQKLTFVVAGLWRKNMILRDIETGSLWQQATGEAVYGKLRGRRLTILFGEQTTWGAWKNEHPETLFAHQSKNARNSIIPSRLLLNLLIVRVRGLTLPGLRMQDKRLPAHEEIVGIRLDGVQKAYPLSTLVKENAIRDKIGDVLIELHYDLASNSVKAFKSDKHEPIIVQRHWWLSWSEFYPHTFIYAGK